MPLDWTKIPRLTIVGCGTAYYAGLVAKYWFEQLARMPVEIDIASEFRYREAPMPAGGVTLAVSQSGETADTLAAIQLRQKAGAENFIGGQCSAKLHRAACRMSWCRLWRVLKSAWLRPKPIHHAIDRVAVPCRRCSARAQNARDQTCERNSAGLARNSGANERAVAQMNIIFRN